MYTPLHVARNIYALLQFIQELHPKCITDLVGKLFAIQPFYLPLKKSSVYYSPGIASVFTIINVTSSP